MIRQQYIFSGLVNRVIDGDTYDITLDLGFYVSHRIRVRLKGVDTPEVYGSNASAVGKVVSDYVRQILEGRFVTVQTYKNAPTTYNRWEADVYFDRVDQEGKVIESGLNLAEHLVKQGYARLV
jgi:micrococcal nuclease